MRAIADPHDDVALVRMMTAGPWRLDALEILQVSRMAKFDRSHLVETAKAIVDSGRVEVDVVAERHEDAATEQVDAPAATRSKLRQLLAALDELNPLTFREGPFTILERLLERTGTVLDLIAADTLEAKRTVTNIASFLRFAADWQAANPRGTLAGFVAYLDAYQAAGGELPTSVELSEDVDGVRLMTLYQAKGLEFPIVFVPDLLDGEWPVKEQGGGSFPRELLREAVPGGDIHTDEERRLLYVAMTRAQERLILTTHGGPGVAAAASRFVGEILDGAGVEVRAVDRTAVAVEPASPADATDAAVASVRRVMPLPTARERRLALRLRASELVGLMESADPVDPEAPAARERFEAELVEIGRSASMSADAARAQGLDPLTFRTLALDSGAGANLLQVAPLPGGFSYSSLSTYERCPLQYAFGYVYRMPPPDEPVAAFAFGTTAHEAFEAFTKDRRERIARGEPPPTRDDLEREFRSRWTPTGFGDKATEEGYQRRVATLLDNFWDGEVSSLGEAIHEELDFELMLDPGDGSPPVIIGGQIDRIDRLPSGGIEVIDYKTGRISSQKGVDESLQLSIYALACRDALGSGHAGAGDAVLHRVGDAHVDDPDGRAAGPGPGGRAGAGVADARRRVRGDAGRAVPVVRLREDVPGAGVMDRVVVAADGTGDASSIAEGIEIASDDAIVLVRPGTYEGLFILKRGIHLQGEAGERDMPADLPLILVPMEPRPILVRTGSMSGIQIRSTEATPNDPGPRPRQ